MLTASFVRMTAAFEFDLVRGAGERGVHAVPDLLQLEERLLVRGRVSVHAAADLVRVERVDGGGGDTESVRAPGDGSTWQASSTVRVVATDPLTAMLGMIHEDGAPSHGPRSHVTEHVGHGRPDDEGPRPATRRSALIRSGPTRRNLRTPLPADAIRSDSAGSRPWTLLVEHIRPRSPAACLSRSRAHRSIAWKESSCAICLLACPPRAARFSPHCSSPLSLGHAGIRRAAGAPSRLRRYGASSCQPGPRSGCRTAATCNRR